MKNNETGEFELVVGNRQLLSGFFIVVLLFAVAFAMGYVVGQNSRQSAKGPAEASATSPAPVESRPQAASPALVAQPESTPPKPVDTPPQPTTQPARDPESAPVPPPAADASPGTYWQVLATANQISAQAMLKTLQDKGFPASLGPGPNNWTRVLVGPFTDTAAMGKAKTELENAGLHPVKH